MIHMFVVCLRSGTSSFCNIENTQVDWFEVGFLLNIQIVSSRFLSLVQNFISILFADTSKTQRSDRRFVNKSTLLLTILTIYHRKDVSGLTNQRAEFAIERLKISAKTR